VFSQYYREELAFLREMGREFAAAHPDAAHFLADRGSDPDVERLLEGFAFLAGQIRQKLDDELPEVTHSLLGLLWPNYLRPIPSMTILQFAALPGLLRERRLIPRGTEIDSIAVDETTCRFQTAFDVALEPVEVEEAQLETPLSGMPAIRLRIKTVAGVKLHSLRLSRLRIYLSGEPMVQRVLYLLLSRYVTGVTLRSITAGTVVRTAALPASSVEMKGFGEQESLLAYAPYAFAGYRVIQEYFAFPQKFFFVEFAGLDIVSQLGSDDTFEIVIALSRAPATETRVSRENFLLGCVTAVNLFKHDADPINVEHDKTEYLVRASGKDSSHYEIYSVDSVVGHVQGSGAEQRYPAFFSFGHGGAPAKGQADAHYHHVRLKPSLLYEGAETYISFLSVSGDASLPPAETVTLELTCTNRGLPRTLRVGDIASPTRSSPEFARFRNITKPTAPISPPMDGDLFWRLISNLSLNYLSLASPEALRGVLSLYNFPRFSDRQAARENEMRIAAITSITARHEESLHHGAALRGVALTVELDEHGFSGDGDLALFGTVLDEFLALYATLNSTSRLTVKGSRAGEVYQWPTRIGRQHLL